MKKFTVINNQFRLKHEVTHMECFFMDELCSYPEKKGWCTLTRVQIAISIGLSKQSVIKLIESLESKGMLIRDPDTKAIKASKLFTIKYY